MTTHEEYERRLEIANAASELLATPFFNKVITHMVANTIKKLVAEPVGSLTATDAHATLRALESLKAELTTMASDKAVLQKQGRI